MRITETIYQIRKSKKITQSDMAHQLGITQASYSKMEKRNIDLSVKQLVLLCDILQVSIFDLLRIADSEEYTFTEFKQDTLNEKFESIEERISRVEKALSKNPNGKIFLPFVEGQLR